LVPAAAAALLWTLQLVSAQLEAVLRAMPSTQTERACRFAFLSGAETCLSLLRGPLQRLLRRCHDVDDVGGGGSSPSDGVDGQLSALSTMTELRLAAVVGLAERTVVSCEVGTLCAVATADIDSTPWGGFRWAHSPSNSCSLTFAFYRKYICIHYFH
jgi:hypothetical protein